MPITQLSLKNFRCFDNQVIDFTAPIVLIQGNNGSGKTSILEALHYLCYLRSFRATTPRDLIKFDAQEFFIKAVVCDDDMVGGSHELQVGFSSKKRIVKIDQKTVASFKELMDFYRVVTLTEDDLALIKEGPEYRRSFIDHALVLLEPETITLFKELRAIIDNRNALLQHQNMSSASYELWTERLWNVSNTIASKRKALLEQFQAHMNTVLEEHFAKELAITLEYKEKYTYETTFSEFKNRLANLQHTEIRFRRSLFGAHLDDFRVLFQNKQSRAYASRGQQKLIVLLLKTAFLTALRDSRGQVFFLLDDFMTDFDQERARILVSYLVNLKVQLIFTSPLSEGPFERLMYSMGGVKYSLSGLN